MASSLFTIPPFSLGGVLSYAAFAFREYGTGIVFVDTVRFDDGTIWHADLDKVLEELRKIESSLEKKDLEEKRE